MIIVACQIYGFVKELTAPLALAICIMSVIYGVTMLACSPIFAVLWLAIAYFYFRNYQNLK
jgi:hypothetical protein